MAATLIQRLKPYLNHPIAMTVLIVITARMLSIVHHYFGKDPSGYKIVASSFLSTVLAASFHLPELLLLGAVFLFFWRGIKPLRSFITAAAIIFFSGIVLLGQIDFGLLRYLGQRFTPSIMNTYVGPEMASSQLYKPLWNDLGYVATSLGIVFASWIAIALAWFICRKRRTRYDVSPSFLLKLVIFAAILYLPAFTMAKAQGEMLKPVEWIFLKSIFSSDKTSAPENVEAAVKDLHRVIDVTHSKKWLDPQYPLMAKPVNDSGSPSLNPAELPDIILFVVESLRGRDVGYGLHPQKESNTPRLDRLAEKSVVYPRFIANGSPSTRAFYAINTSLWPHRDKFVIANFNDLVVDALPKRLKDFGYTTLAFWGSNPSFDNQLAWARRWYDHLDFELPENELLVTQRINDRMIVDRLLDKIETHDANHPGKPIFAYVATTGTHYPYTLEDSYFTPITAFGDADRVSTGGIEDIQTRYNITLKNLDFHIGRVVDALAKRNKKDNTLIVVIGDHADNTNENVAPQMRGYPVDYRVWTSALVYGPERLIGQTPRRESFPASHVDLMPTLLNIIGDHRPSAIMGTDLFAPLPQQQRTAIAIREGGFRIDRGDYSLYVSQNNPNAFWVAKSFEPKAEFIPSLDGTPFQPEEPRKWHERIYYMSYLIEKNRVWSEKKFNAGVK